MRGERAKTPGETPIEGPWKGRTTNEDSGRTLEPNLRAEKSPGPAGKSKKVAERNLVAATPAENTSWKSIQDGQLDRERGAREILDSSSRSFVPVPSA
jgi:hypothetical protein